MGGQGLVQSRFLMPWAKAQEINMLYFKCLSSNTFSFFLSTQKHKKEVFYCKYIYIYTHTHGV